MGLIEVSKRSDIIALIEIIKTEDLGEIFDKDLPQKGFFTYAQKNHFFFKEIIKNKKNLEVELRDLGILWARKSYNCDLISYLPGTFLVFLEHVEGNEWVTLNHSLGGYQLQPDGVLVGSRGNKYFYGEPNSSLKKAKEMINFAYSELDE
jgi:hypothetical protein